MTLPSVLQKLTIGVVACLMALAGFTAAVPQASALENLSDIESGDLIRGESFSAVYYYGADGFRYVFPNSKTYDTWYDDFDDVKWISDADMGTVQIGGNVTYKPGVKMIKINSDPKTYAVAEGGVLRHVGSEDLAIDLYGAAWNTMIDDVADGFFTNYTIGDAIDSSSDYDAADAEAGADDINDDKGLQAPAEISITDAGYSPIDVTIDVGQGVRFTNDSSDKHNATGDDLSWGTGTLQPGDDYIASFDEAGTYTFFDGYDSSNTGAVYAQ